MFMLRRLKTFGLPTADLVTVYCSFIRPILGYCAPVYHNSLTSKQTATLEHVQRRACRVILGRQYNDYASALLQCGLESLLERRNGLSRRFAISMQRSERTADLLPPTRLESHGRCLRNSKTLTLPTIRTTRFSNSPVPSLLRILNENT
ncbi:hypothetical protein Bbelb_158810 [Branchiostoma belcheri]|nr:hypothetical protein Bbelb_158810 [Branchiostoma belcheri]